MNKKGFTLVELLAAITLLALIAMLAVTTVVGFFKKGKEELYQDQLQNIKLAAKTWASDNKDKVNEKECYVLTLKELQDGNYIEEDVKDPRSEEILDNSKIAVKISLEEGKYYYEMFDDGAKATCYKSYSIGNKLIVNNEEYYVINDSDSEQVYVTLLKYLPLTVNEVDIYGAVGTDNSHINKYTPQTTGVTYDRNGYGGMAYYTSETCGWINGEKHDEGCTAKYDLSDVKYVVDAWTRDKFKNNELENVDGYSSRLITYNEYQSIPDSNNWKYASNTTGYWTMTSSRKDLYVYLVDYNGLTDNCHDVTTYEYYSGGWAVRPVINIKKSAIQGGNDNE